MRAEDRLGTIEEGRIANVVIVEGDLFEPTDSIREVWVAGRRQEFKSDPKFDFPETGTLVMGELNRSVEVDRGKKSFTISTMEVVEEKAEEKPVLENPMNPEDPAEEMHAEEQEEAPKKKSWRARNVSFTDGGLSGIISGEAMDLEGPLRFDLMLVNERLSGIARTRTGETIHFMVEAAAEEVVDETTEEQTAEAEAEVTEEESVELVQLPVPLGAYGRMGTPDQQTVLFSNGRIWTASDAGILEGHDLLIRDGVIEAIGIDLTAPEGAMVIDLEGRQLTPGMIDCHSHTGIDGGVNEGGQNNTAEVRIGDVLDPDDINWYRQLAGGLTAANQLHGSANPIGGQNAVVKLRWGAPVDEIHMAGAKPGIKFALGENVVRPGGRYPDTRMGVAAFFEDSFRAASEYRRKQQEYLLLSEEERARIMPPRRDLELDTLVEILDGDRIIHCHSYRQDEILMLLRTAERWGFTIGTLQHILEGYKVADVIAEHGAGASSFSDWWAYKMEVMDAIPYNGAIMTDAGVLVSFNSDSDELARRMNTEAAKAVRYGGVDPHEALKFVTINPAKQLRIDNRTGSIEVGKDADLVVWSGDPLSTMTRCEQTWVDGRRFFDLEEDQQMVQQIRENRSAMLADLVEEKSRKTSNQVKPSAKDDPVSGTWMCSIETGRMGTLEITLELDMTPDGAVTGTAGMAMMDVQMGADGTFDKSNSTLELELTMEGNSVSTMELVITGDSLEGSGESAMRPGAPPTAVTGKKMGSPGGGSDLVLHRGRGSLIARMLDQGDDQIIEMVRNGMDPAEIRAGECGCGGLDVIRDAISEEAAR
jgi:N-acetylglucosamine-6-phosphate deacetylase